MKRGKAEKAEADAAGQGWRVPLPAKVSADLARLYPDVPLHDLESLYGDYMSGQNAPERPRPKAAMRAALNRAFKSIERQEAANAALVAEPVDAYLRKAARILGLSHRQAATDLLVAGMVHRRLIKAALTLIEQPRHHPGLQLLFDLVPLLLEAGLELNATRAGVLCRIAAILIEASGDDTPDDGADLHHLAADALARGRGIKPA